MSPARAASPSPCADGRRRADVLLVALGHFESRARARAAIEAGLVSADDAPVRRASDLLDPRARITASSPHPYASRGGVKLAAGLDAFGLDPRGEACLDVGASTGGFTDALLARGARRVYAVDVGRGQFHPRLAADPRVVDLSGLDARALDAARVPEPIGLAAIDVSFIALRLVLPAVAARLAPGGRLVALIKPQFEAGRAHVGRGGIVRDAGVHARVCEAVAAEVAALGFGPLGLVPSPIAGGGGNREFLIGAHRHG